MPPIITSSSLAALKSAKTVADVATLLGFKKASALSYILYYKVEATKYTQFQIPKKGGGFRKINAPSPDLKFAQENLSKLLQDCVAEINEIKGLKDKVSHGFKRDRSIISNAKEHKNRKYVFNVDISDFFGNINFGRVYGFFMKDQNFALDKRVAAVLGRIACYEDALPQGSPCSPVISNLIGHIMDMHLVKLAKKHGCTYTRYADDLTFSTNKPIFPKEIARTTTDSPHNWIPGRELLGLIKKSRFELNPTKTRMQYRDARQEVTGLIVNKKINVRNEYRRTIRAMVYRLFTKGSFDFEHKTAGPMGKEIKVSTPGNVNQLHGMLGFIDGVDLYNKKLIEKSIGPLHKNSDSKNITSKETMYRRFLYFKEFYTANKPVIVCEGNTDNIYLTHAIRSLASGYPILAEITPEMKVNLKLRLFKYTGTSTGRILKMNHGGYADLGRFIRDYSSEQTRFKAPGKQHPVVVLYDNDSAASSLHKVIFDICKKKATGTEPFVHIIGNLYALATPLIGGATSSCIENFFDSDALDTKIENKTFDPSKTADKDKTYDKVVFAHKVVAAQATSINFGGFNQLLSNLVLLINDHRARYPLV